MQNTKKIGNEKVNLLGFTVAVVHRCVVVRVITSTDRLRPDTDFHMKRGIGKIYGFTVAKQKFTLIRRECEDILVLWTKSTNPKPCFYCALQRSFPSAPCSTSQLQ